MSILSAEALTLRTYSYSESHRIVVFLTREFGKLRAIAYGAKKEGRSRFGASLEPLTHLQLNFSRKQGQELAVVKDCEIIKAFPAYSLSFEVNLHFGYFAELLTEFSNEEEASENLFRLALAVLGAVHQAPIVLLARYLELWLLRLEGVLPRLEDRLPPELSEKTREVLRRHPESLTEGLLTTGELKRLERLSEELIEYHLEKRLTAKRTLDELL